ncbi:MAG: hypothetical protein PVI90_05310 [Desulfobacteraceae bacterium]
MLKYSKEQQPYLKICGITQPEEIQLLDDLGVNFAGVWSGIPEGMYNLSRQELLSLSLSTRNSLKLILVTLHNTLSTIKSLVESVDLAGIQLHGFQLPSFVQQIRDAFGESLQIFKVLHVHGEICVEDNLIQRYIQAGVDIFIIDTFQNKHHIGSTGIPLKEDFLDRFIPDRLAANQIILAGGIAPSNIRQICYNYRPFGIDIDSAARKNGKINKACVARLMAQMHHDKTH